jgi:predicted DsbA family dithiol-disulfide isomerase
MTKYDACMKADTHRANVQAHLQEGERHQVNQTPTFLIGGKLYPGALPYDSFKKILDEELAKAPAAADTAAKGGAAPAAVPATDSAKPPKAAGR